MIVVFLLTAVLLALLFGPAALVLIVPPDDRRARSGCCASAAASRRPPETPGEPRADTGEGGGSRAPLTRSVTTRFEQCYLHRSRSVVLGFSLCRITRSHRRKGP
jgi:hypothetical protein